jgi:hypothetical protein
MRSLFNLVIAFSVIALAACAGASDNSEQPQRHLAGPYIGGSVGAGF